MKTISVYKFKGNITKDLYVYDYTYSLISLVSNTLTLKLNKKLYKI